VVLIPKTVCGVPIEPARTVVSTVGVQSMAARLLCRRTPGHAIELALLAALLIGSSSGCGAKGAGSSPDLIAVKGKVTFKGQPLTTGTVRFEPDDFGRPATGPLQPDGTFVLSTLKEGDGVVAGHHRVSIIGANGQSKSKSGGVPKKYSDGASSKLEAEVSPEKTEFTFDIP
jgi:hypothetical protein